jgi:hypothetical protein
MAMASSDSSSGGNGDRDVFGSLPNTRPQRRSARRDRAGAKAKPATPDQAGAGAGAAAKPRPAAKAKPAAQAKPRPAARAEPAPRAQRAASAEPAASAKPGARANPAAKAAPPRATASKIPPAGYATPRADDDDGVPRGAELVTTAVQAAGELAQIGLAAGGRALKSALGRLPRP